MRSKNGIAVVVPAHNEAALIARTIESIPPTVSHVIVIDDGSEDQTADIARSSSDPRVEVVQLKTNSGVGAAIATGYEIAFRQGADIAVVMAGDGQMDPRDLPTLLAPIADGSADYVKGNRLAWPEAHAHMPTHRFVGNVVLSSLTRVATGLRVDDSQCGYTAISKNAAEELQLDTLWPSYGYPNDLLSLLSMNGLRVADVPVRPVYGKEISGIRWWHAVVTIPALLFRASLRRLALKFRTIRALPTTSHSR